MPASNWPDDLSKDAGSLTWRVGERMDRKRSTVFRLTLAGESGPIATAYYKAPYFTAERQGSRNLDRARTAILSSETMGRLFAEAAAGSGISINETLALDPETLEVVTLGLEGRPFGIPLSHSFIRGRREEALVTCRRVGRAVRLLEGLPAPESGPDAGANMAGDRAQTGGGQSLAARIGHKDSGTITQRSSSKTATGDPGGVTLAHGDLSPDNLIMMKDATGIIDFMWIPQLRGFDLVPFRPSSPLHDAVIRSLGQIPHRRRPRGIRGPHRAFPAGVAILRDAVPVGDDPASGAKGRGKSSFGRACPR